MEFMLQPVNTTAVVGEATVLHCIPPDSHPPAVVTWKKDGALLVDDQQHTLIVPTGNLYLLNLTMLDAGSYQCIATNSITGRERRSVQATLSVVGEFPVIFH